MFYLKERKHTVFQHNVKPPKNPSISPLEFLKNLRDSYLCSISSVFYLICVLSHLYSIPSVFYPICVFYQLKHSSNILLVFLKNLRVFYQIQLLRDCCQYFISQTFTKTQQIPFGSFAVLLKYFYSILFHRNIFTVFYPILQL